MPLSSVVEGIVEIVLEFFFDVFVHFFVRGMGYLVIKAITLGRARVGVESGSALAVGILFWVLILFIAYKLWLA
ncbi:MAG: hypothetical protein AB1631_06025 [Acidobacteriota bacterium]